jgi:anti-sigma factor RsiW
VTADEVRDLFSTAFDEQLTPEQRAAFDAALAGDETLRAEYQQFRETIGEAQKLALDDDLGAPPAPDLLGSVQTKLRKRSRGRFYRDRFSEKTGTAALMPILLAVITLVLLGVVYLMLQYVEPIETRPRQGMQTRTAVVDEAVAG